MTAHPAPRAAARRSSFEARKRSLLVGCALGAAAALLAQPQRASAQAFEATPVFTTPNVNRNITGPTTETITISPTLNGSTTAIINWSFTDDNFAATYDFLPAGNVATFQSAIGENFAVLNRVLIPRPIEFNGRVISQLQQDVGDPLRGGTVIFTNASGIIVSDTAVFDVGNLVLSTLQVETQGETGYGPYFDPNDLSFILGNGSPNAAVITEAGSQIDAPAEGSYVAMVAPIVTHGGTVDVNGSAAYIAAEEVRMTINNGLFDIEVDVGTDNANPLTHAGTTGGPAGNNGGLPADNHAIYMVAVPKNQAITALLTGNIGFEAASDVTVVNGEIILSAGFDVSGTSAQTGESSPQPASFLVSDVQITSNLYGSAATDMFMGGGLVEATELNVELYGGERARLFAESGDTTIVGNATVESNRIELTGEAVGGEALAFAQDKGVLTVHYGLTVDASAEGVGGDGVNAATGGTARVYADGGSLLIGDLCSGCSLTVLADGTGGNGFFVAGGAGTGGTAAVEAFNGGTVELRGGGGFNDVLVRADGTGGDAFFGVGGNGTGGTATIEARDGGLVSLSVAGSEVEVSASGFGGATEFGYGALPGGDGVGGTVSILAGNGGNLVMLGDATFEGSGYGGTAGPEGTGGTGTGGTVEIRVNSIDAQIELGAVEAVAGGFGGTGGSGESSSPASAGGTGGEGVGGDVVVDVVSELRLVSLAADARGEGGEGGQGGGAFEEGSTAGAGGSGGDGTGGEVLVTTRGGIILATGAEGIELSADGFGGTGGTGGDTFTSTAVEGEGGDGGDGFGGSSELSIVGGNVQTPATTVEASGFAGAGGPPGQAGIVTRLPNGGGADRVVPGGFSTARVTGNAGTATGGTSTISIADGNSTTGSASLGSTTFDASAYNSAGTGPAAGGVAGRTVFEDLAGGTVQLADLTVDLTGAASPDGPAFQFISSNQPVLVGGAVTVDTQGDIVFTATGTGGLQAGGAVTADTPGTIEVEHSNRSATAVTVRGGSVDFEAGTGILGTANSVIASTGGDVSLSAPLVDVGIVTASQDVLIGAGQILVDDARADRDVRLDSTGGIDVGSAQAGDDFIATAATDFTGGTIRTTGEGADAEADSGRISIIAGGDVRLAGAEADGAIELTATAGDISATEMLAARGDIDLDAGDDIAIQSAETSADFLADAGGSFSADTVTATVSGEIAIASVGDLELVAAEASGNIDLDSSGGSVRTSGLVFVGGSIRADAAADIVLADLLADGDITLTAPGDISLTFAAASDDFVADAGGSFAADSVTTSGGTDTEAGSGPLAGSNVSVEAHDDLRLDIGRSEGGSVRLESLAAGVSSAEELVASGVVEIDAAAGIGVNSVDGSDLVRLDAGGNITATSLVRSNSNITLIAGGSITAQQFESTAGDIILDAGGNIALVEANAGDDFLADAGGSFTADTVTANVGSDIIVTSVGDLTLDNGAASGIIDLDSSAGSVLSGGLLQAGGAIRADAAVDVALTELLADGDVTLTAARDISLTFATAGDDFFADAGRTFAADSVVANGSGTDTEEGFGTQAGSSIIVESGGNLRLDVGRAETGAVRLASLGGSVSSADELVAATGVEIDAAGNIGVDDVDGGSSVRLDGGGNVTATGLVRANFNVSGNAGGAIDIQAAESAAGEIVLQGDSVRLDTGQAGAAIRLNATAGSVLSDVRLTAGGLLDIDATGDVRIADASGDDGIFLRAGGVIDAGSLTSDGSLISNSGSATTIDSAAIDGFVSIFAGGAADLGAIDAGTSLFVDAASVDADSLVAGGDATLQSPGDVRVGFGQAGDDFVAIVGGGFTGGEIVATGLGADSEAGYGSTGDGSNINIAATGDIRLDDGDAAGFIQLVASEGSVASATRLEAGTSVFAVGGVDLAVNDVDAGTSVYLQAGEGTLAAGDIVAGTGVTAISGGAMNIGSADAGGHVVLDAGGAATAGTLVAGTYISVSAADGIDLTSATAGQDVTLDAGGDIAVDFAQAGDDFVAVADNGGSFTGGEVVTTGLGTDNEAGYGAASGEGSNIIIDADGDVRLDQGNAADAIRLTSFEGNVFSDTQLTAGEGVSATAALDIELNRADAGAAIFLDSGGAISADTLTANLSISAFSGGDMTIADAQSDGYILLDAGGAAGLGTLEAGESIDVVAAGIALDSATAGGSVTLVSDGDITLGAAEAGGDFFAQSQAFTGGSVVTTNGSDIVVQSSGDLRLDIGTASGDMLLTSSGGSILSGDVASAVNVTLRAGGNLDAAAAANIEIAGAEAGGDIFLEADSGDIVLGFAQAGDDFTATAGGSFTADTAIATGEGLDGEGDGGNIAIDAVADLFLNFGNSANATRLVSTEGGIGSDGLWAAGGDVEANAGVNIDAANVEAGGDVILGTGSGDIVVGFAQAGDDIRASAGGAARILVAVATGLGADDESGYGSASGEGSNIFIDGFGNVRLDNGDAAGDIRLTSFEASVLSDDQLTAGGGIEASAAADIDIDDATAGAAILLDAGGAIDANSLDGTLSVTAFSGQGMTIASTASDGYIFLDAAGAADVGTIAAGQEVNVFAGNIEIDSATAGGDIVLFSGNDIAIGFAQAGDDFEASANGSFTGGEVIATGLGPDNEAGYGSASGEGSNIGIVSEGDLRLAGGDAAGTISLASFDGSVLSGGLLQAGADVSVSAGAFVDIADVSAGGNVELGGGDGVDAAAVAAGGDIEVLSGGGARMGSATSGGSTTVFAEGPVDIGQVAAGEDVELFGIGLTVASLQADGDVVAVSEGAAAIELLRAGGSAELASDNDMRLGFATVGGDLTAESMGGFVGGNVNAGGDIVVDAANDLRLDSANAAGSMTLVAGGDLLSGEAGTDSLGSLRAGRDLIGTAEGNIDIGSAAAGGDLSLEADGTLTARRNLSAGDRIEASASRIELLSANAGGDIELTSGGDIVVQFAQAGDDFTADAGGAFSADSVTTTGAGADGENNGANINIAAVGDLDLDAADSAGNLVLASDTGAIVSFGELRAARDLQASAATDIGIGGAEAAGTLRLDAGGDIEADSLAGAEAVLAEAEGTIDVGSVGSDGDIRLDAGGNVRVTTAAAGGDFDAETGGAFTGGSVTAGGAIDVAAAGDLRLDNGVAGATMRLTSSGGDILGGQSGSDSLGSLQAGGDLIATASGDIDLGRAQAGGDMILDAGADLTARGDLSAGGLLDARAGGNAAFAAVQAADATFQVSGTASFGGVVRAQTIAVTSSDIDIGASGGLGGEGTRLVALAALSTGQQTVIGGDAQGPGYTLTAAEAGRITAGTLRITAPANGDGGNRAPDVLVRDVTFDAGRVGQLELLTGGILEVQGNLLLANAGLTNGISIRADERIQVVTPTGSIRVRDADGLPGGVLTLTSNNIWSGSRALLERLAADPNFAGRDAALTQNDGPVEPRGYIEGGEVFLAARDSVFVQNSGTAEQFAGITVVQNTLTITPTGESPLSVFAFGRRINPDGSFVTNDDYFAEVEFAQGSAGYTDESQFNLCFINTRDCGAPPPEPEPLPEFPDGPDPIKEPIDPLAPPTVNTDLVDTSFAGEPLIEEPVTSGADSILWDCEDEDNDGVCDEDTADE